MIMSDAAMLFHEGERETEPIAISDDDCVAPIHGTRIEGHSMSEQRQLQNQVRARRIGRGWSQEELACCAGISRRGRQCD